MRKVEKGGRNFFGYGPQTDQQFSALRRTTQTVKPEKRVKHFETPTRLEVLVAALVLG